MPSLPALELSLPQVAIEARTEEAAATAGDGALAALAGMWAAIFQQQVLPPEVQESGDAWTGLSEAVEVPAPAWVGRVESEVPFLWSAIREPLAAEVMTMAGGMSLPVAKTMPVTAEAQQLPLAAAPVVISELKGPVERDVQLPVVEAPLPVKGHEAAPRVEAADVAVAPVVARSPIVPIAVPKMDAVLEPKADAVAADFVEEQMLSPVVGFETVVALRKKLTDRVLPRVLEATRVAVAPELESKTEAPAALQALGWVAESRPSVPESVEARSVAESLPKEAAAHVELEHPEHSCAPEAAPREAIEIPLEAAPVAPTPSVATTAVREIPPPAVVSTPPPAAQPPAKPTPVPRAPEPPAPMPMPAARESKTISIRIPLTDAQRTSGGVARHIDLVFHQRNQDLTLQFHSPNGEVQRSLEESMPSLLDKLKTDDWAASPQDAPRLALPVELALESRRRSDAMLPMATSMESSREAGPVVQSGSQHFGFDDAPSERNGQNHPQQQGRNRKREQAFQDEFDEQQDL